SKHVSSIDVQIPRKEREQQKNGFRITHRRKHENWRKSEVQQSRRRSLHSPKITPRNPLEHEYADQPRKCRNNEGCIGNLNSKHGDESNHRWVQWEECPFG